MDDKIKIAISSNLKRMRVEKGYSIRQLAQLANIDEKQVRRFENPDHNFSLTSQSLNKLLIAFNCSFQDLIQTDSNSVIGRLYFVSLIIDHDGKPEKICLYDGQPVYEDALVILFETAKKYNTVSAWIDKYEMPHKKETAFHHCFI